MSGLKPQNMPSRKSKPSCFPLKSAQNMHIGHDLDFEPLEKGLEINTISWI
jgi:hypothetical protein